MARPVNSFFQKALLGGTAHLSLLAIFVGSWFNSLSLPVLVLCAFSLGLQSAKLFATPKEAPQFSRFILSSVVFLVSASILLASPALFATTAMSVLAVCFWPKRTPVAH